MEYHGVTFKVDCGMTLRKPYPEVVHSWRSDVVSKPERRTRRSCSRICDEEKVAGAMARLPWALAVDANYPLIQTQTKAIRSIWINAAMHAKKNLNCRLTVSAFGLATRQTDDQKMWVQTDSTSLQTESLS